MFERIGIEEYKAIVRPKVQGAWNLHNALPQQAGGLDFFVMLSSAAGLFGTRGQAVYAGTSTFLGAFAGWRQAQSLPASTIHLSAVGEVGYVAENADRQAAISSTYGDKMLTEREFLAFLRAAIETQHSDPDIYTSPVLSSSSSSSTSQPYWASDAKFAHLRRAATTTLLAGQDPTTVPEQTHQSLAQLLKTAQTPEAAREAISRCLKTKLCSLLMLPDEGDLDPAKPIVTYGLDSLVAVEFRNWMAKEAGARVQLLDLMTSRSWAELVALVASRSNLVHHERYAQADGVQANDVQADGVKVNGSV